MDIDVYPSDVSYHKEFGFGLVVALPTDERGSDLKRSKSLTLLNDEDAVTPPQPPPPQFSSTSETKPKRKISDRLRGFFKRRKTPSSGNTSSTPKGGPMKQMKVPGGDGFSMQTPVRMSPLAAAYEEYSAEGLASEPSPVMKRSLDLDDIPVYIMRAMNEQGASEEDRNKDRVKLKLLTEGGVATKKVTVTRKQKFGLHLSASLPPTIVTFVEPASQCALAGVEVGDQVVAVNGKECFSLTSPEIRDLIYLGRVIKRASLHRQQHSTPLYGSSPDQSQRDSIDEETWTKVKQTEEAIEAHGSSSSSGKRFTVAADNKDSTPLWVTNTFTETSQPSRAKSMYVTTPPGFDQAIMEFSKTSALDTRCPLKHSTPNVVMATTDINPTNELPRAKVARTADLGRKSLDMTDQDILQGGVLARAGETASDVMHDSGSGRVAVPASLSQPTPGTTVSTSPDRMPQKGVSFDNSLPTKEKDAKMVSMSGSLDRSGNFKRSSSSPEGGILPRASIAMDTGIGGKSPGDASAEKSRKKSGLSSFGALQSKKDETPQRKKKNPLSTPVPHVEETEDTEDIVRSFEEAIAASPVVPTARVQVTDSPIGGSDMDTSALHTPQWIRDAAAKRKTRMLDEQSLAYQLQEQSRHLQDTSGARKQLQFGYVGLDPASNPQQESQFLYGSGEFLASRSGSSPQKPLADWQRSKSMEWGAEGLEGHSPSGRKPTLGKPVQIDANVRLRKKSGVMVGKHTAQTSRPTILDFGQSSENVNYPEANGPMAQANTAADVEPVSHTRSLSDDVTYNVPTFEGTEQCKLLDVRVGLSKVHVTRHRSTKKRGASKKEALFLHTGDPERFGDRKVDPANPLQVVRVGQTALGRNRASTGWLRLPQEDRSRDALNVGNAQKQSSSSSDLKGRNIVIETSWKSTKESKIARRATAKPLSSAGLVSRASQKKKESAGDTRVSVTELGDVQENLQRNKPYSKSVVVKPNREEKTRLADSKEPQAKARWPTGVEGGVARKKTDTDTTSSRASAAQDAGGSQTFQVPLRKVPSNQTPIVKVDNVDEAEEPAWVAVARGRSIRHGGRPTSPKSPQDSAAAGNLERSIVSEKTHLPDPIPQVGHVKERLKMFSQLK